MMKAFGGRGTLEPAVLDAFPAARAVIDVFGGIGPAGIKVTELALASTLKMKRASVASLLRSVAASDFGRLMDSL